MKGQTLPLAEPGGHQTCLGCTQRQDAWYTGPIATISVILLFIVYSTYRAFEGQWYFADPYLSPFYSPALLVKPGMPGGLPIDHGWFHGFVGDWPKWLPGFITPAMFILIFPGAFRFTCYYYRKAYYRAFAASPLGCAVGARRPGSYEGERSLLIFQNLHRFALYAAIVFIGILYYDAFLAFFKTNAAGEKKLGFGVGTLVLLTNATLLAGFTFGCNSFRHLVGGGLNWYSTSPARFKLWTWVSALNRRHMELAWASLFSVGLADLYVRLVSHGTITDINTWGF
jgi:hypothetical protein